MKEGALRQCLHHLIPVLSFIGPVKSCVRLKHTQLRVEALDEGGFLVDLMDGGLNAGVGIICNDEQTKLMWESVRGGSRSSISLDISLVQKDLADWTAYCVDLDRRRKRDEALRIQYEAEQRQKEEAERIRKMQEAAKEEAERVRKAQEAAAAAQKEREQRPEKPAFVPSGPPTVRPFWFFGSPSLTSLKACSAVNAIGTCVARIAALCWTSWGKSAPLRLQVFHFLTTFPSSQRRLDQDRLHLFKRSR